MERSTLISIPTALIFFLFLGGLLLILPLILSEAFQLLGFGVGATILLFLSTLFGSTINIPIKTVKNRNVQERRNLRSIYNFMNPRTEPDNKSNKTTIAINLGGALIPIGVSIFLILGNFSIWWQYLVGVLIITFLSYKMAKPVPGVGITLPLFIPPLMAALIAVIMPGNNTAIAYVSGVLGVLLGGDILNLKSLTEYGSQSLSIGGAGTFDGIFLTGIIAVLLASI